MAVDRKYRVTPPAKADLVDIADYTLDRWGLAQQQTYLSGLFGFFEDIATHPGMGRVRTEKHPDVLWRCFQKNHLVFYRRAGVYVEILRVLHVRRDADAIFSEYV